MQASFILLLKAFYLFSKIQYIMISTIFVFFITIILSLTPMIEIRGAFPIAMSTSIWGSNALSTSSSYIACLIGGTLGCFISVAVFLYLRKYLSKFQFFNKIFIHCDKIVCSWLIKFENKISSKKHKKTQKAQNNSHLINFNKSKQSSRHKNRKTDFIKFLIVFTFCVLPGPSGVWTSGALCSILNLSYVPSVIALILANIISCVVIGVFCSIFSEYIDLILLIAFIIIGFVIIYSLLKYLTQKLQKTN